MKKQGRIKKAIQSSKNIYPDVIQKSMPIFDMMFKDQLNENLIYNSLKVYNEKGTNVTSTAGTTSVSNNLVTYTFKSSYLSSFIW